MRNFQILFLRCGNSIDHCGIGCLPGYSLGGKCGNSGTGKSVINLPKNDVKNGKGTLPFWFRKKIIRLLIIYKFFFFFFKKKKIFFYTGTLKVFGR